MQGVRTRNAEEVLRELGHYGVGQTVTIRYLRGGQEAEAQLKLVPRRSVGQF